MFGKFDDFLSFAEKKKISNKPQEFGKKCRVELALKLSTEYHTSKTFNSGT